MSSLAKHAFDRRAERHEKEFEQRMPKRRGRPPRRPAEGQDIVDFISKLTHTGDFNGRPFVLRGWQEQMIRPLFGCLRPDGRRRYTKAFWALPRKQGKTELAAAIVLYLLLGTGKRDQQIYSASGDHEQAALIYRAAATMVRNDPELEDVCTLYDGFKRIKCERLGSFYDALSSDAPTKHGKNPSAVIFDELHVFPNRALFDALTTGFATRLEPLTLMITTAGHDRTSLCYEQWRYAEDVKAGIVDDPEFQAVIYAAGPDDDWTSPASWEKAMPALGDFCRREFIESECRRAQALPAYTNTFKQLYLNQWTEVAERWLSLESWDACAGPIDLGQLRGRPCYAGLDMGISGDMCAFARVFLDPDGKLSIVVNYWAPRDGSWKDEAKNRDRYALWSQLGFLKLTPGATADHQVIEDEILEINRTTPIRILKADRAYATQILSRLYNLHGLKVEGITQGPYTMNEPTVRFQDRVLAGTIRHGGNPILAWNVQNAALSRTATGLVHLNKSSSRERIDGLAAVLNAMAAFTTEATDTEASVYENRGLLFL